MYRAAGERVWQFDCNRDMFAKSTVGRAGSIKRRIRWTEDIIARCFRGFSNQWSGEGRSGYWRSTPLLIRPQGAQKLAEYFASGFSVQLGQRELRYGYLILLVLIGHVHLVL